MLPQATAILWASQYTHPRNSRFMNDSVHTLNHTRAYKRRYTPTNCQCPTYTRTGATPLFIAASWENTPMLESLLEAGADVNKVHFICVCSWNSSSECACACLIVCASVCLLACAKKERGSKRAYSRSCVPHACTATQKCTLPRTHSKIQMARLP